MTISAKIICDSVSQSKIRITTFEIEVPRIVWSEFLTHRMLSRNAASSRAIPFNKMVEQLAGKPSRFGKANAGMQDFGTDHDATMTHDFGSEVIQYDAKQWWEEAKESAIYFAHKYNKEKFHKQVYNRLLEPFQTIKAVITATEWDNFFWLRDDSAADPTIAELARVMKSAMDYSFPTFLAEGQWHLPYVSVETYLETKQLYYDGTTQITLEDAIIMSCARCAAVSYRNIDYDLEKCKKLYERLIGSDKLHSSALEHCAKPMIKEKAFSSYSGESLANWEDGVSHMDKSHNYWSGNFRGWIQHRKTIKGESYAK